MIGVFAVNDVMRYLMFSVLGLAVLVSLSIAVKYSIPKQREWQENQARRDALQMEVEQVRAEITQTKRNIDRFKTSPYFIERLARSNHRVADNEIVFIFQ